MLSHIQWQDTAERSATGSGGLLSVSFEHYRPASVHRERKQKIRGPHWSRKTAEVGLRRHGWVTLPQAISRKATRRSTRRKERRALLPFFFSPLGSPQKLPYSVTPSRVEEEEQRREGERIIPRGGRDHDKEGERESRKGGLRFAYAYL